MSEPAAPPPPLVPSGQEALATFGAGCFWCVETVFERVPGVLGARSGYTGGTVPDPTYKQVCTGTTGHAEAVEIRYDPAHIDYAALVRLFFETHDPTTLNRQGADRGTQYRSAIFYHDDTQLQTAQRVKADVEREKLWPNPIVTTFEPAAPFYEAEAYHQDYFANNAEAPYCRLVIAPKLKKLEKRLARP